MISFLLQRPRVFLGCAIGGLALAFRLVGIGDILTVDEPQWVFRSQYFVQSLSNGDPGGTFQGTHPGVLPMMLIGTGLNARAWWTGERLTSPSIGAFRTAAKIPIAIATSLLTGVIAVLIMRLWGAWSGMFAGLFLGLEPVLVGYSQLAHVDALLAYLTLLGMLVLLLYRREPRPRYLIAAGVIAGCALLTKLPALVLLPFAAYALWSSAHEVHQTLRLWLGYCGVAAAVFVLLWPSMWLKALPNTAYIRRDVAYVTAQAHGVNTDISLAVTRLFYARALLTRMTPLTLFGAVLGCALLLRRQGERRADTLLLLATVLLLLGGLTTTAKRADRYALPIIAVCVMLAGGGLGMMAAVRPRWRAVLLVAPAALAALSFRLAPAAFAYRSPLEPWVDHTQIGWGEGLEDAAAFLNQQPRAETLQVASWYPAVFSEFFRGQTFSLSSRDDPRVDAVVLYSNMSGRGPGVAATDILEEYASRRPEFVASVHGTKTAWVYPGNSVDRYPDHIGELIAREGLGTKGAVAIEAGALLPVPPESLTGLRVLFATFSSRPTTAHVHVEVRGSPDGPVLRTATIPAATLEDRVWRTISFEPLRDRAGGMVYIGITSPDGEPGNAVTIMFQKEEMRAGTFFLRRRALRPGESRGEFARSGDLAVTLVTE